jgi:hypothetical protein
MQKAPSAWLEGHREDRHPTVIDLIKARIAELDRLVDAARFVSCRGAADGDKILLAAVRASPA